MPAVEEKAPAVFPLAALPSTAITSPARFPLTENPHPGHQLPTAILYLGIGEVNSNTTTGFATSLYDSGIRSRYRNGFGYVGNNPLSYTDPSGMFGEATGIGAATCGPVCAGIGAAVDIGIALAGLFGFGGGPPPTIPPALATPSSPILGSASDQGGVFGSGNTSPFVFSAMSSGVSDTTGGFPTDLSELEYWWQVERHHLLPQAEEFRKFFGRAGLDIEEHPLDVPRWLHRLRPFGIHTGEENWNATWRTFFNRFPNANARQILRYKDQLIKRFGLTQYVTRPSILLTIDPGLIPSVHNLEVCGKYICTGSAGPEVF